MHEEQFRVHNLEIDELSKRSAHLNELNVRLDVEYRNFKFPLGVWNNCTMNVQISVPKRRFGRLVFPWLMIACH